MPAAQAPVLRADLTPKEQGLAAQLLPFLSLSLAADLRLDPKLMGFDPKCSDNLFLQCSKVHRADWS